MTRKAAVKVSLACSKCGEHKPVSEFYKHTGNLANGGYRYLCKKCHVAQNAAGPKVIPPKDDDTVLKCNICHKRKLARVAFYKAQLNPNGYMRGCKACKERKRKEKE